MAIIALFGGAAGIFIAAYFWLLFATGLVVSVPFLKHLDVGLLGIALAISLLVLGREGVVGAGPGQRFRAGVLVTLLATALSHGMLWVAVHVDDSLLYAQAAARGSSVQALGLGPGRYVALSAAAFAGAGVAMAFALAWLSPRAARG